MGTRGPFFVLSLVGALLLGAALAYWFEREAPRALLPQEELELARRAESELRAAAGVPDERAALADAAHAAGTVAIEPELPRGELGGRVLDPEDRPLAGALVQLSRGEARAFRVLDPALEREPVAEQLTAADGTFRFTLALGVPIDVAASLAGYSDALHADAYAAQELELVLTPGVLVHGTVTRARDGAPVAGAAVRVFQPGGPATLERGTTTRADGSYDLRVPFRDQARLEVVPAREQCSAWLALALGPGERCQQDVALADGVTVVGRVTDERTGLGLAGASVGEGWWFRRTTTSDARGEYRLEGFGDPDVREVAVRAPGYGAARSSVSDAGDANGVVRLDFALQPARAVAGRVVDDAGAPLEGAYVAAVASAFERGAQRTERLSTYTDAGGRYRLTELAPDLGHALFVARHGYGTQVHDLPGPEADALELPDVVLRRPALLAGRIEDPSGAPLAAVEVELEGANHDRLRFTQSETAHARSYVDRRALASDARGRFWFGDLAAGRYRLVVRSAGRPASAPLTLELATGERREDVVVRLEAGSALRGVVVAAGGGALAGVNVSAQSERLAEPSARAPGHVHVTTGADGRFELAGLPAGEYTLRAHPLETPAGAADEPWLPATIEHVVTDAAPLQIELARGALIRGRCLDARGRPLAGHVVAARSGKGPAGEYAETDGQGAFRLAVPKGTLWTLELRGAPQGESFQQVFAVRADVSAGASDVELCSKL